MAEKKNMRESFDETLEGLHEAYDGIKTMGRKFQHGKLLEKGPGMLWDLFENTVGNGILKTLEGALHLVEGANDAWDKFETMFNRAYDDFITDGFYSKDNGDAAEAGDLTDTGIKDAEIVITKED